MSATTFEYFSSSLDLQCHHYGVCCQHFKPRSSEKRKVYDSVRLIFGRREIFLFCGHSQQHVSCSLHDSFSHRVNLLAVVSSFTCSIKNGKPSMQFLRGRRVNIIHVDRCLKNDHTALLQHLVLLAKDNWDLCLMNTSKLQRMLIIKFSKLLLRFQLTQLLNLFTFINFH